MIPKTTDQNILFLSERIPFNIHCRFNEYNIKLLIIINNYLLWVHDIWDPGMPHKRCLWTIHVKKLDGTGIYKAQLCTSLAWKNA